MEPITHLMTGAVLSRAGFNRKAAYATVAMTIAAEAPDLDVQDEADRDLPSSGPRFHVNRFARQSRDPVGGVLA